VVAKYDQCNEKNARFQHSPLFMNAQLCFKSLRLKSDDILFQLKNLHCECTAHSASIHLFGSHIRVCRLCHEPLDTRHYFGCNFDTSRYLQLIVMARNNLFKDLVSFTSKCYFFFLFRFKPYVLSEDEPLLCDS
jgi:hypothetical protein